MAALGNFESWRLNAKKDGKSEVTKKTKERKN
jgi:hypothetical protein